MVHEIGHMFGLEHCIYYSCLMNGANHLKETDLQPLQLCPVCLRKLQFNLEFDMLKRYEELQKISERIGGPFELEAKWYQNVVEKIKKSFQTLEGKLK